MLFDNVTTNPDGAPEITIQELKSKLPKGGFKLIDVRRPDEYTGELGHIEGSRLVTLETDFENTLPTLNKNETFVFICRSGKRSTNATLYAMQAGFKNVYNLEGGMLAWCEAP